MRRCSPVVALRLFDRVRVQVNLSFSLIKAGITIEPGSSDKLMLFRPRLFRGWCGCCSGWKNTEPNTAHELLSRLTLTGTVPYVTPHTTSTNFILANKAKLKKVAQGPPAQFNCGGGP